MTDSGQVFTETKPNELPCLQFEPMFTRPILGPLLQGKLHVDCTEISLTGNRQGVSTRYVGPGYVDQTESRCFEVTIFVPKTFSAPGILQFGSLPGTLSSSATSLTLEATDELGRIWRAENIWAAEPSGSLGGAGCVVRAQCHELAVQWPASIDGHSLEIWHRGELLLPHPLARRYQPILEPTGGFRSRHYLTTVVADTFQSCGLNFAVFHHNGNTCMRATGDEALPDHIGPRVWEAMLFALGGPLGWSAIRCVGDKTERLRIRPQRRDCSNGGHPPILDHLQPPTEDVWQIFGGYLRYVLKGPQPAHPNLHALSSQVFAVRNSQDASLEIQSLATVVAIENLLAEFYMDHGKPSEKELAAQSALLKHLESWPEQDEQCKKLLERAKSVIGGFTKASAAARLRALLALGAISEEGVEAWKKLRNAATHGDWSALRGDRQGWCDRIGAVTTLFHQLIFHLINYKGCHTDYGTHGYPLVRYPLPTVPTAIVRK